MQRKSYSVFARQLVAYLAVFVVATSACSSGSTTADKSQAPERTTTTMPAPSMPRYQTNGVRLSVSPTKPLFIYNVYPSGAQPELITDVVRLWPKDLLPYLAIQIVPNDMAGLTPAQRAKDIDVMLNASDKAHVPVFLQTLTLFGSRAPDPKDIDLAFDKHPSLVGLGIAELSAQFMAAIQGLQADQRTALASNMEQVIKHDGVLLWADMGYFAQQVFVSAGADKTLYKLMHDHPQNMIVQVKQNGSGRRFGSQSAALGMYLSGMASAWGINSEDWIWYEASLQRLGEKQVPGGLTAAGMTRSKYLTRARLTYPEALWGTEMLVTAASGGSVFSIEKAERGTIDPTARDGISPAGLNVVFPVLRQIIHNAMIPSKETVQSRVRLALQPKSDNDPAFANDEVFSKLYGPDGCTDADRLACAQRQWLPSTGRFGIVPTLPVLAGNDVTANFAQMMTPSKALATPTSTLASDAQIPGIAATGDSWATMSVPDVWFAANPNENNLTTQTTFALPAMKHAGNVRVSGTFGPYDFMIADGRSDLSILVDNYRSDMDTFWDKNTPDAELEKMPLSRFQAAAPASTTITLTYPKGAEQPTLTTTGAKVAKRWNAAKAQLTLTFRHRDPVKIIAHG